MCMMVYTVTINIVRFTRNIVIILQTYSCNCNMSACNVEMYFIFSCYVWH